MDFKFLLNLSLVNIKKRFFLYRIYSIAVLFSTAILYNFMSIVNNAHLYKIQYTSTLKQFFNVGIWIVIIFAFLFTLYANHFLLNERKKEFALYQTMGLEKKHIFILIAFEHYIIGLGSAMAGIISGALFSNLIFLILMKLINGPTITGISFYSDTIVNTFAVFLIIFTMIILTNVRALNVPTRELFQSAAESEGSLPPIAITLFSILFLYYGYTVIIESQSLDFGIPPIIFATYLLFTVGFPTIMRKISRTPSIYDSPLLFIAISCILYRIKQNALSLAIISILCSVVLCSTSYTIYLYDSIDNWAKKNVGYDLTDSLIPNHKTGEVTQKISELSKKHHIRITRNIIYAYHKTILPYKSPHTLYTPFNGIRSGDNHVEYSSNNNMGSFVIRFLTIDEYNKALYLTEKLDEDEVLVLANDISHYSRLSMLESSSETTLLSDNFRHVSDIRSIKKLIVPQKKYDVKYVLDNTAFTTGKYGKVLNTVFIVTKDLKTLAQISSTSENSSSFYQQSYLLLDFEGTGKEKKQFSIDLTTYLTKIKPANVQSYIQKNSDFFTKSVTSEYESHLVKYGSVIMIGGFIAFLCLIAALMFIYFKQISDAHADKNIFQSFTYIGMDADDIRNSIKKQVIFVFYIPLGVALFHELFTLIYIADSMENIAYDYSFTRLTVLFSICFLYTVFYSWIYRFTSVVYYRIVLPSQ